MAENPEHPITITSAFPPRETAPSGYLEPIRSAGGVLWRGDPDTVDTDPASREVLLVHRPDRDDWSLPKGKVKNREHLLCAAVREVTEETGLAPVLGRRVPPQRYLKEGWPKQVEWWAATAEGESAFAPNDEIDRVEWLPLEKARRRLTYGHDIQVVNNFASGPARTFPIVLLRHAAAGDKSSWDDDLLRPLDPAGRADAQELAPVLAAFGAPRVVSSAAARCTETMLPFTVDSGADMRTERAFTAQVVGADTAAFDREAAAEAFVTLLEEGRPTVVCTHGELIPFLMREALGRLGAPVTQQLSLRKAAFWVLHIAQADRALAAVERHAVRV
ncbi:8-oxo-dGTP diphosphatase [Streptomonospora nanhaiensis]|uniref:8-oxo-dGTP diphosphatase n=1 Tax=Streptomonospora nanhaiensis TaxID=1323731 RepID=A0A853BS72_9ACTN|nr:NUDIX domain-containing protein [Streptomonospora nanhaiensis]NYI97566.1 8-oxo-dGTP diphosphatase [Streptomonospora nanhaiensis]